MRILALSLALVPLASFALSQPALHPCAAEADPGARLACYDRAFPPTTEGAPREAARPSEAELREEFGLSTRELEQRRPQEDRAPRLDSIESTVAAVRGGQGGQRVVTLDNGQVWQLTEGSSRGPLKRGDDVVIRRAMMGSFILITPGGVGLRARRVR